MAKKLFFLVIVLLNLQANGMLNKKYKNEQNFVDAIIAIIGKKFNTNNLVIPKIKLLFLNSITRNNTELILDDKKLKQMLLLSAIPSQCVRLYNQNNQFNSINFENDTLGGYLAFKRTQQAILQQFKKERWDEQNYALPAIVQKCAQTTPLSINDLYDRMADIRMVDLDTTYYTFEGTTQHLLPIQEKNLMQQIKKAKKEHTLFKKVYEKIKQQPTPIFKKKPEKGFFDLIIDTGS